MLSIILTSHLVLVLGGSAAATRPMYEADVRPILKEHCFQCHGERAAFEGNLDLRLRRFILKGGDSGPAIVPGDATGSLLIQRVTSGEMPPDEDKRLSTAEVEILSRWVDANAPTATAEPDSLGKSTYFTDQEKNWWAFRPVRKPPLPATDSDLATPIDAFISAKLAKLGEQHPEDFSAFKLSKRAERPILIRRIYLDMLGIPPSPEDVQRFVVDSRPDAWNRVVDRVLASPRYGERWARHWLDVAGYADSEGYTDEDRIRDHAWRYRDYVIRALNRDKPYSEFITEQLAGDELVGWPNTPLRPEMVEPLAATGFLRMAPDGTASGGIDQGLARNQVIADTIQIFGTAVLGMSVQCAQCHDHRYDPIPQRNYYQLRAVFEPAFDWNDWRTPPNRLVSMFSEEERQLAAEIEARARKVDAERQAKVEYYIEKTLEHELLMIADKLQQPLRIAFHTKSADRTDEQKQLLEAHANIAKITAGSLYLYDRRRDARANDLERRRNEKLAADLDRIRETALQPLGEAARRNVLDAFDAKPDERTEAQRQLVKAHAAVGVTAETLAEFDAEAAARLEQYASAAAEIRKFRIRNELQEFSDRAKAIRVTKPKEPFLRLLSEEPGKVPATFVFHRGDHQQPKEKVEPRGLAVLDAPNISRADGLQTSGRRLQFARYLTNGKHPLVARVLANRVWAHHFGRGIVATTGDFGYLGERPTHPELLDWLAAEFVESGWSIKRLHRLILTSRVYGQSAVGAAALRDADPDNLLLGRWPLRRLESETLRDAILSTTGKLTSKMYGEPVPVMEDEVGQIVLGKENLDGERKPTKPIPLKEDEFRRSIYVQVRRTRPLGVLESFDFPSPAPNCTERASSNVAPQALMLMNSDFIATMSAAMADRLLHDCPGRSTQQLRRGWHLTFGRPPSDAQLARAQAFLKKQTETISQGKPDGTEAHRLALATYCQALFGSNQFLYIE